MSVTMHPRSGGIDICQHDQTARDLPDQSYPAH